MKIKMLRNVMSDRTLKGEQVYDLPDADGQALVNAGYAVKLQDRENTSSKQAANRETAVKGNKTE